ncbi:GDSL-type esterase/lipase family protein [Herbiconiux sp. 11R-BC]|uniref:GDSL-type esterase/lipase family protein n=1 Tax=Herbiconiux sp. 11R-BC TaxID=3111637 RepID=UPI003C0A25E1
MGDRMIAERFPSPAVEVVGALELEPRAGGGVRPRRLPAWTRRQIPSPAFDFVLRMTSGVRLAFSTSANALELEVSLLMIDPGVVPPDPARFDLVVDGVLVAQRVVGVESAALVRPEDYEPLRPAPPVTVAFSGLGDAPKAVELWLPHGCATELLELRSDAPLVPAVDARPRWVHHGSSISQGGEAFSPTQTWPVLAASLAGRARGASGHPGHPGELAGLRVQNLGFSGNATGDPFVARTMRDLPADLLSAEIGINLVNADLMRRRSFEPLLHGFIDTVREGHPETPLLLIGPIPCPAVEELPGPTITDPVAGTTRSGGDPAALAEGALSLGVVRDVLAAVLAARSDDPNLHYLDGWLLLPPEETGSLGDGLHPDAAALRRMGERFAVHAFGAGGPLDPWQS